MESTPAHILILIIFFLVGFHIHRMFSKSVKSEKTSKNSNQILHAFFFIPFAKQTKKNQFLCTNPIHFNLSFK